MIAAIWHLTSLKCYLFKVGEIRFLKQCLQALLPAPSPIFLYQILLMRHRLFRWSPLTESLEQANKLHEENLWIFKHMQKYAPEHNRNKSFSTSQLLTFVLQNIEQIHSPFFHPWHWGNRREPVYSNVFCVIPKWWYYFSVFLSHSRWRSAKMASVDLLF